MPDSTPPLPEPFDMWRETDDDCGAWARPDRPVFTADQLQAYAAPLIARVAELERQNEAQKDEWLSWDAKRTALEKDAARYRLVRRGQHWSVIDGIGNTLRADELDKQVDAAIAAKD